MQNHVRNFDLLNSDMGRQIVLGASNESNQPADKTAQVVQMALPLLMGAMKRNASNPQGQRPHMNALNPKTWWKHFNNLGLFLVAVDEDQKKMVWASWGMFWEAPLTML